MSGTRSLKETTNDELYGLLKHGEAQKSWTIGQLGEYERRGRRTFDHDKSLVTLLDATLAEQNEKLAEIWRPYQEEISRIAAAPIIQATQKWAADFARTNTLLASKAIRADVSVPTLSDVLDLDPRISDQPASSPGIEEVLTTHLAPIFARQDGHLSQIARNTKWDWKQWVLFALALVAAVTGVFSAVWR